MIMIPLNFQIRGVNTYIALSDIINYWFQFVRICDFKEIMELRENHYKIKTNPFFNYYHQFKVLIIKFSNKSN